MYPTGARLRQEALFSSWPYPGPLEGRVLKREDGARFEATIQDTEDGPQASFLLICDVGNETLTETDIQVFCDETAAMSWLDLEASHSTSF
jgi:hypothetical protein